MVHVEDFFVYAECATQRFDCAAGNPPFIRYQRFNGAVRHRAIEYCKKLGASFSALSSSWAHFLVATASLLKAGGRMAFVVPAEIGHAPYAAPLLTFLCRNFGRVQLVLVRDTVFEQLSQDVWFLFAEGHGSSTNEIELTQWEQFRSTSIVPRCTQVVTLTEWSDWGCRLRPFLVPAHVRQLYQRIDSRGSAYRLGEAARVGIGYVTGGNDFFHFRPSEADSANIPKRFLRPTVRSGRVLNADVINQETLLSWNVRDEPYLLLHLLPHQAVPGVIQRYLNSSVGKEVRKSYKCRNRSPWYAVPDVVVPDGFLTYMSGSGPTLVGNSARCTCTNSIHAVRMKRGHSFSEIKGVWNHPLTQLSAELEGHPLGGGMLKLEPSEANRIMLPRPKLRLTKKELQDLRDAQGILRLWRHYG